MAITIRPASLEAPDFIDLIETHAALMLELSPPDSCHFLPIEGLKKPSVTVWAMYDDDTLIGSGALQHLDNDHGEIKSMHTRSVRRGEGLGRRMLQHILNVARERNYRRLSLETGSQPGFEPARKLYEAHGFVTCGPFGAYTADPNSCFMTLSL